MMTFLQSNPYDGMNSGAGAMAMGTGSIIFTLIFYLFFSYCLYKIFQKAGRQDAWAAFIPIYNTFVLVDVVKKPILWFILMFIPLVNIVIMIMLIHRLSKFFGKGTLMTIVILFLPFIGYPVLAFSDAVYHPTALPDDRK